MENAYNLLAQSGYGPVGDEAGRGQPESPYPEASPIFKYLFDKYKSLLNQYDALPTALVALYVQQLTDPFLGEYAELNDSPEFLEVSSEFFSSLFWNTCLYVSYEDINELINSAIHGLEAERIDEILATKLLPEGKAFQLGYMEGLDENKKMRFLHLGTDLTFTREDWKTEFIRITGNGLEDNDRFINWYNLAYRMLIDQHRLELLCSLCTKRIDLVTDSQDTSTYREAVNSIYNGRPYFHRQQTYLLNAMRYIDPAEYKDFQTAIYLGGDRALSELGRVANTNPKMERLTTGENYKDIVAVANRQRMTLNQLKLFAQKAQAKGNISLNFAIKGIPQRAPMDADIETPQYDDTALSQGQHGK